MDATPPARGIPARRPFALRGDVRQALTPQLVPDRPSARASATGACITRCSAP
jgi:hypothetical protein